VCSRRDPSQWRRRSFSSSYGTGANEGLAAPLEGFAALRELRRPRPLRGRAPGRPPRALGDASEIGPLDPLAERGGAARALHKLRCYTTQGRR
jgi:hypothetical protein